MVRDDAAYCMKDEIKRCMWDVLDEIISVVSDCFDWRERRGLKICVSLNGNRCCFSCRVAIMNFDAKLSKAQHLFESERGNEEDSTISCSIFSSNKKISAFEFYFSQVKCQHQMTYNQEKFMETVS